MDAVRLDVAIFGGGAAGLWLVDELRRAGRSAVLLEADRLGRGQTVSSQGILHSGLKYSLQGLLTSAAREAREMPALWRRCLEGACEPNLSGTRVLSDGFHLWGTDSAASRIGLLGARMGLRVTPEAVAPEHVPAALAGCGGTVYRVPEQVIAPQSFLECLADRNADRLLKIDPEEGLEFARAGAARSWRIRLRGASELELAPRWIVLAAGAGNEALRVRLELPARKMQRRPLHMVLVRGALPDFHGHCLDGAKTRVSITSGVDRAGRAVWQVGGQVSEDGVGMEAEALIQHARAECRAALPGVDFSATEWSTYRVDRAEGGTLTGGRPDSFRVMREGNILTGWPTKLVLAPQLAAALLEEMRAAEGREPEGETTTAWDASAFAGWPRPQVASPPWDDAREWRTDAGRKAA
jgi:glycine/D-amino acid oxidase-like deaminating enzyme